jgi:hypothetical protein
VKDLAAKTNDHEFIVHLNSLYESLMAAREKILELQEENMNLKADLRELKDHSDLKKDLEFKGFGLFKRSTGDGPFCNACWGGKDKLVNLHDTKNLHFKCPSCKEVYCSDPEAYQNNILSAVKNAGSSFNKRNQF